ncbi:hypothetical protein SynSYN20_02918 [Synechococcus sp. SYN20]|nr:hypothetical protein SynSYN20_02918 [Synechococcus sp. SYN20]
MCGDESHKPQRIKCDAILIVCIADISIASNFALISVFCLFWICMDSCTPILQYKPQ